MTPSLRTETFQKLFDHGVEESGDAQAVHLRLRMLHRKGAEFMLLPLDNQLAVKALTLYAPQNLLARFATALLRLALKVHIPVPLKTVDLRIRKGSTLIKFFTDALNLSHRGATDFAVIAGNPKDAARRYVCLLFDVLHRPALVVKVGLGKEGSATVARESQFLSMTTSEDGVIPEPHGSREAEEFAAFSLKYQPGGAPTAYEQESLASCLTDWIRPGPKVAIGDMPIWKRLSEKCAGMEGFAEIAEVIEKAKVHPVIQHGDLAPWNIKIRPEDGRWVVLDWERGEPEGLPGWDWFHYVVQTGVLVENMDEKTLRAKLIHIMESDAFAEYAARTGIASIKLELALLYLVYNIHVLGQAGGEECLLSLYQHLRQERRTGIDRARRDVHTFWAARQQGRGWLAERVVDRIGAGLAWLLYRNRLSSEVVMAGSGVAAIAGVLFVANWPVGFPLQGAALFLILLIYSCLASARGMLARVVGGEASVSLRVGGAVDLATSLAVLGVLAAVATDAQAAWLPEGWRVPVLSAVLATGIAVLALGSGGWKRPGAAAGRVAKRRNWASRFSDGVWGALFLGAAWSLGMFWDYLALKAVFYIGAFVYALASGKSMAAGREWLARFFNGVRRTLSRFFRRVLFFQVFLRSKKAQLFSSGSLAVQPGFEQCPVPGTVDLVYLWKDESDADWVARREAFLKAHAGEHEYNRIDLSSRATRSSLDRLKFSMRSVDQHFRSLGRIFVVTDRQRPRWLREDDERVRIVDVRDIVEDPAYLPSYNSQAIESYFYNIPGLSEFFVYLNDDFFFTSPVESSDFFTENGKLRVRLGRAAAARGVPSVFEEGDTSAQKNANLVLDRRFKRESRLTVMHRPYAHRKSLMKRAEQEFPEEFHLTRRSHFRSVEMFALHSFLVPYWAYYMGMAELVPPKLFKKDMFSWSNDKRHNAEVVSRIGESDQMSFCIQAELSIQLTEESISSYRKEMESVFPVKSQFEL